MVNRWWDWRRIDRLARLAAGLVVTCAAVIVVPPWVAVFLTSSRLRHLAIGLLVGLKIGYGVVLAGSLFGAMVFGAIVWDARRHKVSRPVAARGLLLCGTLLICVVFIEAIAAAWGAPARSMPAAARDPELPTRFAESDDKNEVTLVVVGESSAAGAPYERWLSVGPIVAWKLGEVIPGRRFRAIVLAHPGDTLEIQYRKLAALRRRPDAVIVYCGHNEFSSRIAWSRKVPHYRDDRPSLLKRVDQLARTATPLCGLIQRATDRYRIEIVPPSWFQPPLVDVPAYTPKEYAANLADFRRRLEEIAAFAERVGALPILVVPPGNDAGFEPVRSFLRADTPRRKRETFALDFAAARRHETSDPARSIQEYRTLLARQPRFAESHYRLAQLLEKAGAWAEAYRQYVAARDLDGMPMRCLSSFQLTYLDVAESHDCVVVDGQALFHAIGPHGMLDDSLFNDIMHPSLRGHIALAHGILDGLHERGAFGWPDGVPTPAIDPARCADHFGVHADEWAQVCAWGEMFYGVAAKLLHDPDQCRTKQQAYSQALRRIKAGVRPESLGLPNVGIPVALPASAAGRPVPQNPQTLARPVS